VLERLCGYLLCSRAIFGFRLFRVLFSSATQDPQPRKTRLLPDEYYHNFHFLAALKENAAFFIRLIAMRKRAYFQTRENAAVSLDHHYNNMQQIQPSY
jgi:hypothetical protein